MRHAVSIRDVSAVAHAASILGTPSLRDDALAVAPHAAPSGASREDVARVAAALIVVATGGDPARHGLPPLSRETLDRAAEARRDAYAAEEPLEERCARLERELAEALASRDELAAKLAASNPPPAETKRPKKG